MQVNIHHFYAKLLMLNCISCFLVWLVKKQYSTAFFSEWPFWQWLDIYTWNSLSDDSALLADYLLTPWSIVLLEKLTSKLCS